MLINKALVLAAAKHPQAAGPGTCSRPEGCCEGGAPRGAWLLHPWLQKHCSQLCKWPCPHRVHFIHHKQRQSSSSATLQHAQPFRSSHWAHLHKQRHNVSNQHAQWVETLQTSLQVSSASQLCTRGGATALSLLACKGRQNWQSCLLSLHQGVDQRLKTQICEALPPTWPIFLRVRANTTGSPAWSACPRMLPSRSSRPPSVSIWSMLGATTTLLAFPSLTALATSLQAGTG